MKNNEQKTIKDICNYLQLLENNKQLYFFRCNTGARIDIYKGKKRFFKFGKKGISDIMIFLDGGDTWFIECKSEKGEMSPEQMKFAIYIRTLGYKYNVVRSLKEFTNIFEMRD